MNSTEAVLRDVAARIIQHHFREKLDMRATRREGRESAGTASAGGATRRPATPPAPKPPATRSVLDFMPGKGDNAASTSRPASKPPRPRAPVMRHPRVPQPPVCVQQASTASPPKPLPLEDSAERMNRAKAQTPVISAAVQGTAGSETQNSQPLPAVESQRCASPQLVQHPGQEQSPERPQTAARKLPVDVRASASTEKMGHIMRLIEQLERQAVEEARQVTPSAAVAAAPALPAPARGPAPAAGTHATQPAPPAHPMARVLAAQPLSIGSRQVLAAAAADPTAVQAVQAAGKARMVHKAAQLLPPRDTTTGGCMHSCEIAAQAGTACLAGPSPAAEPWEGRSATSVAGNSQSSTQPSAAAVASSVRERIKRLQAAAVEKDAQIAAMHQSLATVQSQHEAVLRAAEDSHKAALAAQKADAEAGASRSLQFLDRVMAEKDALAERCSKLSGELACLQGEAVKQIEALKEGLARELRKQKEVWVAAERTKREAWMVEQTRAIKEATVKGLEPEIQRLVESNKAEVKKAEQRHEAHVARRLAAVAVQHEEAMAALRAQWAGERAAVVEAERAAAREQVKDAQGRFEVELQSLRMRLAAEHQMQLDRADTARRDDQARLAQATQEHEQRVAALRAEWEAEHAQLDKQRQREVDAVRQEFEVNQEAWRAAASERARREMEAREAGLRRQLAAERDEELAAVVARLEEDALAKEAVLQKELEAGEAAAEERWRREVASLRDLQSGLQDKCAAAEAKTEAAGVKIGRLEELVHTLQREVSGKGASLAWLEDQLAAAKKEAASRQEAGATALAAARETHAAERGQLQAAAEAAQEAAARSISEAAELRQRRVKEMSQLEARFSALLATKDSTIAALTQQLEEVHAVLS